MALVQQKIGKLQAFINKNPALRKVPFAMAGGRAINPEQALSMLRTGQHTQSIINQLAKLGVDPPEDYALAIARLQALAELPGPAPKIHRINKATGQVSGGSMSIEEAIRHIQANDDIGKQEVEKYRGLKSYMALQMRK